MIKFPLNKENKRKDWDTIHKIAWKNNFPQNIIKKLKNHIEHNKTHQKPKNKTTKKWTTFTYYSPQIRKVTNLFKHTGIKIAFRSNNNIQQLIQTKKTTERNNTTIAAYTHKHVKHANINT
jgi:hypothetical protein